MSSPVITLDCQTRVSHAARLMVERKIGSLVVLREGEPWGIVTERDIIERVVAPGCDPNQVATADITSSPLICIKREAPILEAIRTMRSHNVRRLVIITDRVLEGIITEGDLIRAVAFASLTSFRSLMEIQR